ncbi:OmpW family outer membrane protein [Trinickia caryophylli]|uniref:Outer membrane protein n=1 Tax=Trinickia caryophylli TaxID=28094 RepID=A0A1X7FKD7_TRICW|nr:OmpW family outer membrane protein [Trinickia caryophylli]PMS13340.1 OmpW family protein [Trinickia caryophylli]TRX19327.1 OmpW family protein [Trinickia caryophylli]WQE13371.1 OmpW family outer membrane protein [Trinickia caryophylli]SMF53797.1 outer membrane protein [Trinickia caryophylli]GLU34113.1 outer membrane protein [Trinickia caryophylli]
MKKLYAAACAASAVGAISGAAHAQQAGDNVVTLGWFHVMPQDSSTPLTTNVSPQPIDTPLRLPSSFTSSGTGLSTSKADTAGLVISHFFTDHIALTTVAGVPPTFKLYGRGKIVPPGPAAALGTLDLDAPSNEPIVKSVRQWSPAVLLQYYFASATARFRPFVGVGVSYNWFSSIQLNPNFVAATQNNLGAVLAAGANKPGPTTVEAKASPSWAPVFNLGGSYSISKHWGVTASLTYIPLKTKSTVTIKAADGSVLGTTEGQLKADPLISFLAVSYRF